LVNRNKINKGFVVFCHLKLLQHTKEFINQFEKEVVQLTEVLECFHVSGDYDYILKVHVKDMDEFREFFVDAGNVETGIYRWDALGIRFFTNNQLLTDFVAELKSEFAC